MNYSAKWYWLAIVALVGFILYLLAPVLTPFVIAALLAYLGDPVVDRLAARKIPRVAAVCIVFVVIFAVLTALPFILLPAIEQQVARLVLKLPQYIDWIQTHVLSRVNQAVFGGKLALSGDLVKDTVTHYWQQIGGFAQQAVSTLSQSGLALVGFLANLVLIPVVTFYLLRDWDILVARIHDLLPRRNALRIGDIARESDRVLGAFLRGQLTVMSALGLIYAVGLSLLGLDFGMLIGLLAGLVSFVPYLGFIVGIGLAGIAALIQFQDIAHVVAVVAIFGIGQLLEGFVLTPKLVGNKIGLHPVAVIFAVMAGGQLFGLFGVLLALPTAAVIVVVLRHIHHEYTQSDLYRNS